MLEKGLKTANMKIDILKMNKEGIIGDANATPRGGNDLYKSTNLAGTPTLKEFN